MCGRNWCHYDYLFLESAHLPRHDGSESTFELAALSKGGHGEAPVTTTSWLLLLWPSFTASDFLFIAQTLTQLVTATPMPSFGVATNEPPTFPSPL